MDQEINLMGFNERNPMSANERNLINANIKLLDKNNILERDIYILEQIQRDALFYVETVKDIDKKELIRILNGEKNEER